MDRYFMDDRLPSPPSIPPAPPLPPLQRFQKYYESLYRTVPVQRTPSATRQTAPAPLLPVIRGINAFSSQDAYHRTGLEISALDTNHDRTLAILAGREILKTVRVAGVRCSEETNIRNAIINYASHNANNSARQRETLDIHDVKWSHGHFSHYIATAATNGKIVLYDLNRASFDIARLHEHYRQVHKLAFNPHQPYLLLSGSQDASVRIWDLRDTRQGRDAFSCRSKQTYQGLSEGIRDLRWSPTDGVEFAIGTDNGVIQRWDIRSAKAPKLKISAHDKTCHAIDWHPDGKHLISASSDKTVKVWDFSSEQKRQKPTWSLRLPYPVSNVRWRPSCLTTGGSGSADQSIWQCTQIATSFEKHAPICIWDFRRPHVPFREIVIPSTPPTDLLWHSQHLLWTVGREGIFTQVDVQFASKVLDRRNLQAVAISPTGEISAFAQKRSKRRASGLDYAPEPASAVEHKDRCRHSENVAAVSLRRSSADDGVDDSFLRAFHKRHHGRSPSNRSSKSISISSTPPSHDEWPVADLETVLSKTTKVFRLHQAAFRGSLGGSVSTLHFAHLAQKYQSSALKQPQTFGAWQDVTRAFEQNADYAQRAAAYRTSQSFRIMGASVAYMLRQRAEYMRRRRLRLEPQTEQRRVVHANKMIPAAHKKDKAVGNGRLLLVERDETQSHEESLSNVPTPLAKPHIEHASSLAKHHVPRISDLNHEESFLLGPAVTAPPNSDIPAGRRTSSERRRSQAQRSQFQGPDWLTSDVVDVDQRRAALSSYRQQPKPPLDLGSPNVDSEHKGPITISSSIGRRISDESFAMFSTSGDSRAMSVPGSFASSRSMFGPGSGPGDRTMESVPEAWEKADGPGDVARSLELFLSDSDRSRGLSDQQEPDKGSWNVSPVFNFSSGSLDDPLSVPQPERDGGRARWKGPDQLVGEHAVSPKDSGADALNRHATNISVAPHASPMPVRAVDKQTLSSASQSQGTRSGTWSTTNTDASLFVADSMEASGTIVPEGPTSRLGSPLAVQPAAQSLNDIARLGPRSGKGRSSIVADDASSLLPDDPEAESPFSVIDLVHTIITYHTSVLADAQTASHLLLLVAPLLPPTVPPPEAEIARTLTSYSDHLSNIGLSPAQIQHALSTSLSRLLHTGLHPLQVESILSSYHSQLLSASLFTPAAHLRRLCYPAFPAVYEQALKDTSVGLTCRDCGSPINNPRGKRCEGCGGRQAKCPVCWCEKPGFSFPLGANKLGKKRRGKKNRTRASSFAAALGGGDGAVTGHAADADADADADALELPLHQQHWHASPPAAAPSTDVHPTLWLTCPLCNHSGHFSCLLAWFSDSARANVGNDNEGLLLSQGACPSPGCSCDCAPGALRDDRAVKLEARMELKDKEQGRERGRVRGDEWVVAERGAVERVRRGLAGDGVGKGEKRVRLVEPDDVVADGSDAGSGRRGWVMGNCARGVYE